MDGVSWTTSRPPESFSRSKTTTDTLSRLASFIARADAKQQRAQRPQSSAPYACQECEQLFPRPADLLQHQEVKHALPKPHRCPSCGRGFSLRSSLQLHRCGHAPSCQHCRGEPRLSSPCVACGARSSDVVRLQDAALHLQPRLLDSSPYACAPCGRGFSQKQALLHHQQAGCSEPPPAASRIIDVSSLPDDSPPVSEADSAPSDSSDTLGSSGRALSECAHCSRSFHTETGLQRHREAEHTGERQPAARGVHAKAGGANFRARSSQLSKTRLLSCRSCDLVFRSTPRLLLHRKEKHSREKGVLAEARPLGARRRRPGAYPCQVCGKVFLHHLSLRAHYKHHSELSSAPSRDRPPLAKDSETPANKTNAATVGHVSPRKTRREWRKCDVGGEEQKHPPAGGAALLTPHQSSANHRAAGRPRKEGRRPREQPDEEEQPKESRAEDHGAGARAETPGWRSTGEEPRGGEPGEEEQEENDEEEEWMFEEEEDRLWMSEDEDLEFDDEEEDEDEEEEQQEEEEEQEEEFPCPSCPEVFALRSQLGEHVELHESSGRWRSCSVCANDMDTRRRRSKRLRLYHCVPCRHGFSSLDAFLQHCQEHLRVRVEEDFITEGHAPNGLKT